MSSGSQAPTTKLQPTKSNEPDAAAAAAGQKPQNTNPSLLEEDDEFEDFPVEGISLWLLIDI